MLNIDPTLLLVLTACLYILVFGGLSSLRREGLSVQFAIEAIVVTAVLMGGSWLLGLRLSPVLLLVVLYLVTMRSRLLVDLANLLARRKKPEPAQRVYRLALACRPDASSRLLVLANRGAAELYGGQVEAAIHTLEGVLAQESRQKLGLRQEAATRYNLGYAYERNGQEALAVVQYNQVIDLLPGSLYARAATAALKRRAQKDAGE